MYLMIGAVNVMIISHVSTIKTGCVWYHYPRIGWSHVPYPTVLL